jgi:hypothetical protein
VALLLHTHHAAASGAAGDDDDDDDDAWACAALTSYTSFYRHQWRPCALMYISRWCGAVYTHNNVVTNTLLRVALCWPFRLLFVVLMSFLLFVCNADLPAFVRAYMCEDATRRQPSVMAATSMSKEERKVKKKHA